MSGSNAGFRDAAGAAEGIRTSLDGLCIVATQPSNGACDAYAGGSTGWYVELLRKAYSV